MHVGQLHRAKRVDRAIKAAAQAMQDTDAHLLVVGDGPQKASLMDLCSSLGIDDRTHFPGYITAETGLPEVYRAADAFITASEIETQGIVLLEAAASGLPIAAVDATCIGEIVHDGVNGYLTGSGDTGAMSEAIRRILRETQIAGEMSAASRSLAENHSNIETIDNYERIYDMLPGREPVTHLRRNSRHERLYNWLAAIVRR